MITVDQSVPPPGSPPEVQSGGRSRTVALVAALAVAGAVLAAGTIGTPYYAIGPGDVLAVDDLVEVVEGPSYEAEGHLEMVTVRLGRVTLFGLLHGWLDGETEIVDEQLIKPPTVTDEEFTEQNQALMAASKEKAQGVAFEALGEDAIRGDGARVVQIVPDSPAAGVLAVGDVITAVDGEPTSLDADAVRRIGARAVGDEVALTLGGDRPRQLRVRLGSRPGKPTSPFLGVGLETQGLRIELPRKVEISSEEIGGPSAGLAFTLQVLDELTPGELTGGNRVAATGTIELDGTVGEIGGIVQKTAAVRAAGLDVFLVPRGEYEEARRRAGPKLRVIPVETVDDALRALASLGGSGLGSGR